MIHIYYEIWCQIVFIINEYRFNYISFDSKEFLNCIKPEHILYAYKIVEYVEVRSSSRSLSFNLIYMYTIQCILCKYKLFKAQFDQSSTNIMWSIHQQKMSHFLPHFVRFRCRAKRTSILSMDDFTILDHLPNVKL